jgi:hypothetical protein
MIDLLISIIVLAIVFDGNDGARLRHQVGLSHEHQR